MPGWLHFQVHTTVVAAPAGVLYHACAVHAVADVLSSACQVTHVGPLLHVQSVRRLHVADSGRAALPWGALRDVPASVSFELIAMRVPKPLIE